MSCSFSCESHQNQLSLWGFQNCNPKSGKFITSFAAIKEKYVNLLSSGYDNIHKSQDLSNQLNPGLFSPSTVRKLARPTKESLEDHSVFHSFDSSSLSPLRTPTKSSTISLASSQKTPLSQISSQIASLTSPFQRRELSSNVIHSQSPMQKTSSCSQSTMRDSSIHSQCTIQNVNSIHSQTSVQNVNSIHSQTSLPNANSIHSVTPTNSITKKVHESNVCSVTRSIITASPSPKTSSVDQRIRSAAERKLEREREKLQQTQKREAERLARIERNLALKRQIDQELAQKKHQNYSKVIAKGKEIALTSPLPVQNSPRTPKFIPEINSDDCCSTVVKRSRPDWCQSAEISKKLLIQQMENLNPEVIFGEPKPFNPEEVFSQKVTA